VRTRRQLLLVVAAVLFAALMVRLFGRDYVFFDMRIYHGAMRWWTSGGELYEFIAPETTLGYTYPPFAAITMAPIAAMSYVTAGWINAVLSAAALGWVLAVLLVPIADRCGWPRWVTVAVALPLTLALEPGRETLGFGQINLLLFALIFADLVALSWSAGHGITLRVRGHALGEAGRRLFLSGAWAGAGVGLATAVKLTPGLFILYFIVARQWRPAMVASGTALGATVVAWLVAPRESTTYFTSLLWQTERVGAADFSPNQALSGLLARLYDQPDAPGLLWFTFALLCLALGLSRAVSAHREGDEVAAFTLVGLTGAVISPISWTHHLVFVIPALIVIGDAALRGRAADWVPGMKRGSTVSWLWYAALAVAGYVVFVVTPVWWVRNRLALSGGSHYDSGLLGVLAENSLALALILLLVLAPWRPGAYPVDPGARYRQPALASRP
jgi:alpha-1,2-mannosyltransferase